MTGALASKLYFAAAGGFKASAVIGNGVLVCIVVPSADTATVKFVAALLGLRVAAYLLDYEKAD